MCMVIKVHNPRAVYYIVESERKSNKSHKSKSLLGYWKICKCLLSLNELENFNPDKMYNCNEIKV